MKKTERLILEAEKGPATPSTVLFEAASPKSTVIRSGPKKKVRVDSPVEVRRCLFNSPSGALGDTLVEPQSQEVEIPCGQASPPSYEHPDDLLADELSEAP